MYCLWLVNNDHNELWYDNIRKWKYFIGIQDLILKLMLIMFIFLIIILNAELFC